VEAFQQFEHRSVLVVEEPSRHVHGVIRRDADEVLVEGAVVDRAEA
jgi:hypothetical protein